MNTNEHDFFRKNKKGGGRLVDARRRTERMNIVRQLPATSRQFVAMQLYWFSVNWTNPFHSQEAFPAFGRY